MKAAPSIRQLKAAKLPNVVVLPTAAPRQVNNHRYAAQRQAKRVLRDEDPWPGEHKWPHQRQREAEERLIAEHGLRTPELLIVMTMMEMMDVDQHARLADRVQTYAAVMGDGASATAALITNRLLAEKKRKGG